MPLARIKIEDGIREGESWHEENGAGERTAAARAAAGASIHHPVPTDEVGVQLLPHQAARVRYPPGSCVLFIDSSTLPPAVTFGTVKSVALSSSPPNDLVFCILPQNQPGHTLVAHAHQLQWGPSCPVFARPIHLPESHLSIPAVILQSYHSASQEVLYTVHDANDPEALFHGIPDSGILRFRPNEYSRDSGLIATQAAAHEELTYAAAHVKESPTSEEMAPHTRQRDEWDESPAISETKPSPELPPPPLPVAPQAKRLKFTPARSVADADRAMLASIYQRKNEPDDPFVSSPFENSSHSPQPATKALHPPPVAQVVTKSLRIPMMVRSKVVKDFLIGNEGEKQKELENRTGCTLEMRGKLLGYEGSEGEDYDMYVLVTGKEQDVDKAVEAIEDLLLGTVGEQDRGRLLYYFGIMNQMGQKERRPVWQRSPFDLNTKVFMAVRNYPPHETASYFGPFIGKNRHGLRQLEEQSGCRIFSHNRKDDSKGPSIPHIFVTGSTADDVNHALKLIGDRMHKIRGNGCEKR